MISSTIIKKQYANNANNIAWSIIYIKVFRIVITDDIRFASFELYVQIIKVTIYWETREGCHSDADTPVIIRSISSVVIAHAGTQCHGFMTFIARF